MADAPYNIWNFVSALAWPAAVAAVAWAFRKPLSEMFENLNSRIRSGALVKIGSVEIGALNILTHKKPELKRLGIEVENDNDDERSKERNAIYQSSRNVCLVHQLAPSTVSGQLYDILIYVITHQKPTLSTVTEVQYFFGRFWDNQIYISKNRENGFAVATSAYGPFLCTARLVFNDGGAVTLSRYIDFEMGKYVYGAAVAENPKPTKSANDQTS